jgi:hypothetical protein
MDAAPGQDRLSSRQTIAGLILILCSLLSSGRILWDARTPEQARKGAIDIAQRSDQRFAAVKTLLPQRGVIGYIGEPGALARGDYYLAEYALAPLVIDDSPGHALVLANFPDAPPAAPANLQLIKDFGNGVGLFANRDAN